MFDKLVVSSSDMQRGRSARFLVLTALSYVAVTATALAASILTYDARMAGPAMPAIRLAASMPAQEAIANPGPQRPGPWEYVPFFRPAVNRPSLQGVDASLTPRPDSSWNGPPSINGPSFPDPVGTDGGGSGSLGNGIGGVGEMPTGTGTEPPPKPKPTEEHRAVAPRAPVRVSPRVLQGKVITRITPAYPELAKIAHISGTVTVEIILSPEGVVESARAVDGPPILIPGCIEAARGWRFQPTLLGDVPVRVTGIISFVFNLN